MALITYGDLLLFLNDIPKLVIFSTRTSPAAHLLPQGTAPPGELHIRRLYFVPKFRYRAKVTKKGAMVKVIKMNTRKKHCGIPIYTV